MADQLVLCATLHGRTRAGRGWRLRRRTPPLLALVPESKVSPGWGERAAGGREVVVMQGSSRPGGPRPLPAALCSLRLTLSAVHPPILSSSALTLTQKQPPSIPPSSLWLTPCNPPLPRPLPRQISKDALTVTSQTVLPETPPLPWGRSLHLSPEDVKGRDGDPAHGASGVLGNHGDYTRPKGV